MKMRFLIAVSALALLLSGCATSAKEKATKDKKTTTHMVDLNGDGAKEIIEAQDKFDTDGIYVITVKRALKKKETEDLDSFTVPGKMKKLEFIELYFDKEQQIAVTYVDKDNVSGIMVYQLKNDKLSQIFVASSKYGVEGEFVTALAQVKIGKPPRGGDNSPNRIPEWEVWVWTGDKFIKE
jgi:hypothetical protein